MKVIALGAHPDDIEIGCGGAILRHRALGHEVMALIFTGGCRGGVKLREVDVETTRREEALKAAALLDIEVRFLDYTDTEIPETHEVIMRVEEVIQEFQPDRVYLPYGQDTHQDHRVVSNTGKAACRGVKQILEYEEPSSYNSFNANYWIDITPYIEKKLESIKMHVSQGHKQILKLKSIEGLNLYRGYQSQVEYAEGFSAFRFLEE
jgi:LmbE family N-acetylglucosaminyl deacetylase